MRRVATAVRHDSETAFWHTIKRHFDVAVGGARCLCTVLKAESEKSCEIGHRCQGRSCAIHVFMDTRQGDAP